MANGGIGHGSRMRPEPRSEPITVLHVDDEPDMADLVATYLERIDERLSVTVEMEPSRVPDRVRSGEVDAIISDFDMPGMNGLTLLERVRSLDDRLPFILFTGKGSEDIASEAISKGVTDYLQKSGGQDQYDVLANRVSNAVERYRAEQ